MSNALHVRFPTPPLKIALNPNRHHLAVDYALKALDGASEKAVVSFVVAQSNLSAKRFTDVFKEAVGITPKLYGRIMRFQRALDMSKSNSQADWASIALACGFYDQAHLINDFKCLSDLTPAAYAAMAGPERNRVPLIDSVR